MWRWRCGARSWKKLSRGGITTLLPNKIEPKANKKVNKRTNKRWRRPFPTLLLPLLLLLLLLLSMKSSIFLLFETKKKKKKKIGRWTTTTILTCRPSGRWLNSSTMLVKFVDLPPGRCRSKHPSNPKRRPASSSWRRIWRAFSLKSVN